MRAPRFLLIPALLAVVAGYFGLGYVLLGRLELPGWALGVAAIPYIGLSAIVVSRLWGERAAQVKRADPATAEKWRRQQAAVIARRVAEIENDPVKSKYLDRIKRGEYITDAQMEYWEDPNAVWTCEHLQPLERAIRKAGIKAKPVDTQLFRNLQADCAPNEAKLRAAGYLQKPVEFEFVDGGPRDPSFVMVRCQPCNSAVCGADRPSVREPGFPA